MSTLTPSSADAVLPPLWGRRPRPLPPTIVGNTRSASSLDPCAGMAWNLSALPFPAGIETEYTKASN